MIFGFVDIISTAFVGMNSASSIIFKGSLISAFNSSEFGESKN